MFYFHQLRDLVGACINPDPNKRPDVEYVLRVAETMHESLSQQPRPSWWVTTCFYLRYIDLSSLSLSMLKRFIRSTNAFWCQNTKHLRVNKFELYTVCAPLPPSYSKLMDYFIIHSFNYPSIIITKMHMSAYVFYTVCVETQMIELSQWNWCVCYCFTTKVCRIYK